MAELIEELGPLGLLPGVWEGDKGADNAPSVPDRGQAQSDYRERIVFEPTGQVDNHEQVLFGLRYRTTAWRLSEGDTPFHEEVGYWLWDAANQQVMRCFIVPRGVTVFAGGTVDPGAGHFHIVAEHGSTTYGICSNQWLDTEFRTVKYELKVTMEGMDKFSYWEDTVLKIKGQEALFHHTDENTMHRVE